MMADPFARRGWMWLEGTDDYRYLGSCPDERVFGNARETRFPPVSEARVTKEFPPTCTMFGNTKTTRALC
jgi:hypothetical protein